MTCLTKFLLTCLVVLVFAGSVVAKPGAKQDQQFSIIPQPLSLKETAGNFLIGKKTIICVDENNSSLLKIGEMLSAQLKQLTGYDIIVNKVSSTPGANTIFLTQKDAIDSLGAEGYSLSVETGKVIIRGLESAGVFYGMQTFLQLLPVNLSTFSISSSQASSHTSPVSLTIPGVQIMDKPRFGWRGMMLDVGRYFYSVDFIKKYIDYLAMHKMNTFHWHLTEDHGWRIEIKKYPKLTDVSAWREATQYDKSANQLDRNPHGGYYTQDQIRDVIAYAKDRFVNIVPEIEMPGHSLAALVAYPELSCSGGPLKIPDNWGIQKDVFCAGNEQTFKFLEDVLTEIADLFPSPIIHIGGDECPKDHWKTCPKCQERIKAEGLKDEHELQSYFITRIEKLLLTKNKRIIGWDEILEGGLAPKATVMSWRGIKGGIAAAKQHHDVVMAPTTFAYFDYYQGEPYLEPAAIGGFLPLDKVYSYEPVPTELNADEASFIKGVQATIWSEFIHSPERVEYMSFPRVAAIAEIGWTNSKLKNWEDFKRRLDTQYKRYEITGINYSRSALNVMYSVEKNSPAGTAVITLRTNSYQPEIRYTIDSTEPKKDSPVYQSPVTLKLPGTIKAAVFLEGRQVSKVSVTSVLK
jgi:hexosaminidase